MKQMPFDSAWNYPCKNHFSATRLEKALVRTTTENKKLAIDGARTNLNFTNCAASSTTAHAFFMLWGIVIWQAEIDVRTHTHFRHWLINWLASNRLSATGRQRSSGPWRHHCQQYGFSVFQRVSTLAATRPTGGSYSFDFLGVGQPTC